MVFIGLFAFKVNVQIVQAPPVNEVKTHTSQFDGKDTIVKPHGIKQAITKKKSTSEFVKPAEVAAAEVTEANEKKE